MRSLYIGTIVFITCLTASASETTAGPRDGGNPEQKITGSDRDAHGCIASAGYTWCARTGTCERPWELSASREFDNDRVAFDLYCDNPK